MFPSAFLLDCTSDLLKGAIRNCQNPENRKRESGGRAGRKIVIENTFLQRQLTDNFDLVYT